MSRKTISARLRFEILRRDKHACRYCGCVAPDVKLTVDHVIPVSLGGSNDPQNLVTACEGCNSGKSSMPADAPFVADVSARAAEFASVRDEVMAERRSTRDAEDEVIHAWNSWTCAGRPIPYDPGWRKTVRFWIGCGFDAQDLIEMLTTSMQKDKVGPDDKWRYFCGIVWNTLNDIDERVAARISRRAPAAPVAMHAEPCPYSRYEEPAEPLTPEEIDEAYYRALEEPKLIGDIVGGWR